VKAEGTVCVQGSNAIKNNEGLERPVYWLDHSSVLSVSIPRSGNSKHQQKRNTSYLVAATCSPPLALHTGDKQDKDTWRKREIMTPSTGGKQNS